MRCKDAAYRPRRRENGTIDSAAGSEGGRSKSEVIRDAIGVLARQIQEHEETERPFETVRDLIGSIHSGPPDLSVRTGEQFRRMVQAKRRGA